MGTLLLTDLADYLSSGGIAPIVVGRVTESPEVATFLIETGGMPPDHAMSAGPGTVMEWPRVQVFSRAFTYEAARQLAHNVYALLDGMGGRLINGTYYGWCSAVSPPWWLGDDDNRRAVITCNYQLAKALSTSTST